VLARASRDVHAKFLLRNGADRVIYPEKEMAVRLAVQYSSNHIFDYIALTPDYSIYEVPVPAIWAGKTIVQTAVRTRYHISILATKKNGRLYPLPKPDHEFDPAETLIILGRHEDVKKLID
jgi:trk system potassium uptake protein TrkA